MYERLIVAGAVAAGAALAAIPVALAQQPDDLQIEQALRPLDVEEGMAEGQYDVSGSYRQHEVTGTVTVSGDSVVGVLWTDEVSVTVTIPITGGTARPNDVRRQLRDALKDITRNDGVADDEVDGITDTVPTRGGNPHTIVTATTPSGTEVRVPEHAADNAPGLRHDGEADDAPGQRQGQQEDRPGLRAGQQDQPATNVEPKPANSAQKPDKPKNVNSSAAGSNGNGGGNGNNSPKGNGRG